MITVKQQKCNPGFKKFLRTNRDIGFFWSKGTHNTTVRSTIRSNGASAIHTSGYFPKIRRVIFVIFFYPYQVTCQCGVVVITPALHAEGRRFNPGH